ncbi:MAG: acetyl-CoA hydrolase/transferase family protein [Gammaproteobacteria bacterium]|mgnify:FL=1|nr:MAG: acetyl-CoA hydrolase/transferase family protein [Gammaproteobacteria bacterium]
MNKKKEQLFQQKKMSAEAALDLVQSKDYIVTALAGGEPVELLHKLHTIRENGVRDCEMSSTLPMANYEFIKNPEYSDTIFVGCWFFSAGVRAAHPAGNVSHVPKHLHSALYKRLFAMADRRKVLFCSCSPMDKHGYLSMGMGCTYERDLVDHGAIVIVEVNPNVPRTLGDTRIHITEIDAIVETNNPVPALPDIPINEKDKKIGEFIAEQIEDGSTIQLGIGAIPNAVAESLKVKNQLGIHTEMFTDGMADLIECGAVDHSQKTLYRGQAIATFVLGSKRLYDFVDDNPGVLFKTGSWTNDPYVVAQNHKMVSINTSIEVDLMGQCSSESIGLRQYSGTGGQADTAIGAQMCPEGKSFIALYSTADVKDDEGNTKSVSCIVPTLKPGSAVTLSRNDVDYVVTEYGVAWLRGQSIRERVKRLIAIAHPDFRDQLKFEAEQNRVW